MTGQAALTSDAITTVIILAAVIVIAVGASYWFARRRIQEIHVLVNRRLEVALQEVKDLKAERDRSRLSHAVPSDMDRVDDG